MHQSELIDLPTGCNGVVRCEPSMFKGFHHVILTVKDRSPWRIQAFSEACGGGGGRGEVASLFGQSAPKNCMKKTKEIEPGTGGCP